MPKRKAEKSAKIKRPRGRPRKADEDRDVRPQQIRIRLYDVELDALRRAAAAAGLPVGTWLRQTGLDAAARVGRR